MKNYSAPKSRLIVVKQPGIGSNGEAHDAKPRGLISLREVFPELFAELECRYGGRRTANDAKAHLPAD